MKNLSVVVTSSNEAKVLARCLESVAEIAGEIVVFNNASTDDTETVAKKFGARIVNHDFVDYVEIIRNESIQAAKLPWVLLLDPDETISPQLAGEIEQLTTADSVSAYNIPRKNIFWGTWIAHTNFWPDRHIRLFRKDKVDWPEKIHTYPKVEGVVVNLPADPNRAIVHYGYDNLSQFFERQNRYTTVEAENRLGKSKFSFGGMIWESARVWLARYVKHLGFLDGYSGLFLVYSLMITQISISVKLWERSRSG